MKIVLPGGTGQVGNLLARAFHTAGHDVVALSRHPVEAPWSIVHWDAQSPGSWAAHFDDADVIINLAGRSVNCRYHAANRKAIMDSRVNSTRLVGETIARAAHPPRIWMQMSTATIYEHTYGKANGESNGVIGGNEPNAPDTWCFSIDVATSWERAANEAQTPKTRKVLLRSSIVLSPDHGGIFDVLLRLVRFGLGGTCGDGRQFMSWIHGDDFVRAVNHLIEHETLDGPVNVCAPNPLTNAEFMRELRKAWGTRIGLPATKWMIELGAFLLRTESELVLKSRKVVPETLLADGFKFQFPEWPAAASDLCAKWRASHP